jgi:hypothetical protein
LIASSTWETSAGSAFYKHQPHASQLREEGKKLTAGARSRVDAREEALSGGDGALETLNYLSEVVTDAGLFIELLLEVGED